MVPSAKLKAQWELSRLLKNAFDELERSKKSEGYSEDLMPNLFSENRSKRAERGAKTHSYKLPAIIPKR